MWSISRIRFPSPTPKVAVLHSPTPSRVRIAACVERAGEEGAGGVALVVVGEDQAGPVGRPERVRIVRRMCSLSLSQSGIARRKLAKPGRGVGEVGLQQPLELGQRLVVEGDVVERRPASGPPRAGNRRPPGRERPGRA